MNYPVLFFEGIITFISPCLLPMLPVYVLYFAGGGGEKKKYGALVNSLFFVLGFSAVFILMGAFAGFLGSFLTRYKTEVNIAGGLIVIVFGLNYIGLFRLNLFRGGHLSLGDNKKTGPVSAFLFGVVFSVGWTPCVGAFLGTALLMASSQGTALRGIAMLAVYSLGLGIPFVLSAVLIDKLKSAFDFIKRHYRTVNAASGALLIAVGVLMATGVLDKFLHTVI